MGKLANKRKMSHAARAAKCAKSAKSSQPSTASIGQAGRAERCSIDLINAIADDDLIAFNESSSLLEEATGVPVFETTFRIRRIDPLSGQDQVFEGGVMKLLDKSKSYKILNRVCKFGISQKIDPIVSWMAQIAVEYDNALSGVDQETAEHLRLLMHCIYEPWDKASAHFWIKTIGGTPLGLKAKNLVVHLCTEYLALDEQQELEASVENPSTIELPSKARSL